MYIHMFISAFVMCLYGATLSLSVGISICLFLPVGGHDIAIIILFYDCLVKQLLTLLDIYIRWFTNCVNLY